MRLALEEREVLKSTNQEDLRTARDRVTQCQDDHLRYIRLEGPRDKDSQTLAVDDAERALAEAQAAYKTAKESYDSSIFSDSEAEAKAKAEVEKAQKNVTSAETKLNSALLAKKLFKRYTYPNKRPPQNAAQTTTQEGPWQTLVPLSITRPVPQKRVRTAT